MLRITVLEDDGTTVSLRVEGRVVGDWARLLEAECYAYLAASARLHLELAGVSYVDAVGARVLASLPRDRVQLRNQSVFLLDLIEDREAV